MHCRLPHLYLTWINSKVEGQSRTHLDLEYPGNCDMYGKKYYYLEIPRYVLVFDWHIYI